MDTGIVMNANAISTIEVGYNANLSADVVAFSNSLERADTNSVLQDTLPDALTRSLISPFAYIDDEAGRLVDYAQNAVASGNDLSPSEVIMLTARSQEFMFHSQLTANVANRTADGLQQLFRQQS